MKRKNEMLQNTVDASSTTGDVPACKKRSVSSNPVEVVELPQESPSCKDNVTSSSTMDITEAIASCSHDFQSIDFNVPADNKYDEVEDNKKEEGEKENTGNENKSEIEAKQEVDEAAGSQPSFTMIEQPAAEGSSNAESSVNIWPHKVHLIPTDLRLSKRVSKMACLDKKIKLALRKIKIRVLFPVQTKLVTWHVEDCFRRENQRSSGYVFQPCDICVCTPTGSGKTLAYIVPIMQALVKRVAPRLRAIILVPTQELSNQISGVVKRTLGALGLNFAVAIENASISVIYNGCGGAKIVSGADLATIHNDIDVLISTPGRILDLVCSEDRICLDNLQQIIFDEADRLLECQPNKWVEHFLPVVDSSRGDNNFPPQKLLFSATLSQDPSKLSSLKLFRPTLFTTEVIEQVSSNARTIRHVVPPGLTEFYIVVKTDTKPATLHEIFQMHYNRILVFTKSCLDTNRLTQIITFMNPELPIFYISSELTSIERRINLEMFAHKPCSVLIASDLVARGIDIPNIDLVINYDVPKHPKGYVHRVGRTGRGQSSGTAITFLTEPQVSRFNEMLFKIVGTHVHPMYLSPREITLVIYDNALYWLLDREQTLKDVSARLRKYLKRRRRNARRAITV